MIHTYRDPDVLESRGGFFRSAFFPLLVLFVFVAVASGDVSADLAAAAGLTGLLVVVMEFTDRRRRCGEIRLGDDGTCEFETKHRVIRLHVNEIRSVQYRSDDGQSYTVRYEGGKLGVTEQMAGFHDFLARLKTLNPAVDLSGFPADAWPGLGRPEVEDGITVRRLIRYALFPLFVICSLVFLAIETFAGR